MLVLFQLLTVMDVEYLSSNDSQENSLQIHQAYSKKEESQVRGPGFPGRMDMGILR
jgi:hypothetical protein